RRQLENTLQELENATGEKDRILKAVSHDMRSPINSSLALVDILRSQTDKLDEEQLEYIDLIKKSNENALGLTKDLLEVATLNTEQLEKEPVDITSVMRDRVKLLKYKAAEKGQELRFSAPDDHITATVNEEKILRILSNLVTNAIKFSSIGGVINIDLNKNPDSFILKVQDNGIGIPDKMKGHVFDLFSEAKRFGTSGEQPFGLGLSITKQIVEAHSGKIWFESEEGRGTTFYVEIPL
ncbi:MAG: HAMP domain-containing histidine kinase, partial [Chitinophagaceae bacterium]|nr:HAMP domain-containing histidine kinase [Chitinophagaceae bacterium]